MSTDPNNTAKEPPVDEAPEVTPEQAESAAAEGEEAPGPDLTAALADAEDRYLRLRAEFENYKKRTGRENEDFRKYANESLLRELLPVLENLDRAIVHTREADEGIDKLLEGVEMIQKQFMDVLDKFGVKPIPAAGEKFDPSMHQAVSQVETEDLPDGAVAEEFRKGYFYKERVLRPAMVVVAKNTNG